MKVKDKLSFTIPKKILLLSEVFKIEFRDLDEEVGFLNLDNKTIILDNSLKNDAQNLRCVLWHELGHYFAKYYAIEDGEIFASAFSNFVNDILKQLGNRK